MLLCEFQTPLPLVLETSCTLRVSPSRVHCTVRRRRNRVRLVHRTDEDGRVAVCAVPGDVDVTVQIRREREWHDVTTFRSREGEVTFREVWFSGN